MTTLVKYNVRTMQIPVLATMRGPHGVSLDCHKIDTVQLVSDFVQLSVTNKLSTDLRDLNVAHSPFLIPGLLNPADFPGNGCYATMTGSDPSGTFGCIQSTMQAPLLSQRASEMPTFALRSRIARCGSSRSSTGLGIPLRCNTAL